MREKKREEKNDKIENNPKSSNETFLVKKKIKQKLPQKRTKKVQVVKDRTVYAHDLAFFGMISISYPTVFFFFK